MDEVKFESNFSTKWLSWILKMVVRKKFGYDIDIMVNNFRTTILEDKTHAHLDLDVELTKEELTKLLKAIGR